MTSLQDLQEQITEVLERLEQIRKIVPKTTEEIQEIAAEKEALDELLAALAMQLDKMAQSDRSI